MSGLDQLKRLEADPVNYMPVGVRLVTGNYCAGASASATTEATGFPASGASDGNRTELVQTVNGNKPYWLSVDAPSLGSPQVLTLDLGASKRANYFKLYFLKASRPLTYVVSVSPDNSTWTDLFGTDDIADAGVTPAFTITDPHDSVVAVRVKDDTSFYTFRYVKLTVYRMVTGVDPANCVELECYRKLLITDRVLNGEISRDRDYSLNNILASTAKITCSNRDRYFSVDYVPQTRVGDSFINTELKPGIGLEIFAGGDTVSQRTSETRTETDAEDPTAHFGFQDNSTPALPGNEFGLDGSFTGLSTYAGGGESVYFRIEGWDTTNDKIYDVYFFADGVGLNGDSTGASPVNSLYPIDTSVSHQYRFVVKNDFTIDLYVDGVFASNLGGGGSGAPTDKIDFGDDALTDNSGLTRLWTLAVSEGDVVFTYDDGAARLYTGKLDRITVRPGGREAVLEFRDSMKELLRRTFSGGLLQNSDIGDIEKYLLNAANISDYEMSVDSTAIILGTFFTSEEFLVDSLRDLVVACGDATLYFDEYDQAVARMYMAVGLEHIFSSAADFEAGGATLQNVTDWSDKLQRKWFLVDDFADSDYTSNPAWTVYSMFGPDEFPESTAAWEVVSNVLRWNRNGSISANPFRASAGIPLDASYGTWKMNVVITGVADYMDVFFATQGFSDPQGNPSGGGTPGHISAFSSGYLVRVNTQTAELSICRKDGVNDAPVILSAVVGVTMTGNDLMAITRDPDGNMAVYWNGVVIATCADNTYTSGGYFGMDVFKTALGVVTSGLSAISFSHDPTAQGGTPSTSQAVWSSGPVDQGAFITAEGNLDATTLVPSGTSLVFETRTSDDRVTWDSWVSVTPGSAIGSTVRRFIEVRITFNCPQDSAGHNTDLRTPIVFDVTLNWSAFAGSVEIPGSSSRTFRYDDVILDIEQELTDTVGGDSAIANLVTAQAMPIVLVGNDSDIQWQGTVQIPPVPISVDAPLQVYNGDVLTFEPILDTPTDTSLMSGSDPAAATVTFGDGATGTWRFTKAHPTRPVLEITITADGVIDGLTVTGKSYQTAKYGLKKSAQDDSSILQYGVGSRQVSSPWIHQNSVALSVAEKIVERFAQPLGQLTNLVVRLTPSIRLGDRITVVDDNTAISRDFFVVGVRHNFSVNESGADSSTTLRVFSV